MAKEKDIAKSLKDKKPKDIKKTNIKKTEKLIDRHIINQLNVERASVGTSRKITKLLNQLQREINDRIILLGDRVPLSLVKQQLRIIKLQKQIKGKINNQFGTIEDVIIKDLHDLAAFQNAASTKDINATIGVELIDAKLTDNQLNRIVNNSRIQGALVKDALKQYSSSIRVKYNNQLTMGMLIGESPAQLTRRVRSANIMNMTNNHMKTLVRTSFQSVSQTVRTDLYKKNSEVIGSLRVLATLDSRTSDICMARSGLTFKIDNLPFGHPPWHHNCRSTLIPVVRSLADMVIDPVKREEIRAKLGELPPGTQASIDGQVSANLNYEGWLKTKPVEFQMKQLGPSNINYGMKER